MDKIKQFFRPISPIHYHHHILLRMRGTCLAGRTAIPVQDTLLHGLVILRAPLADQVRFTVLLSGNNLNLQKTQEMTWSLIKEAGIGLNTEVPAGTGQRSPLRHPVFAARSDDGSYLIVDELGREKLVPYGFGCRTIRVDADHNILYDSLANGIEDGFGCLMNNGCVAILRRTNWELLIVSPDGEVTDRLRLATFSKRLPWSVAWTCNETFLIVFVNRAYDLDIIEIDSKGRLLWSLPANSRHIGIIMSAQLTPSNTVLVADPIRHVAAEIDRAGNIVWQFGETKHPSRDIDHLSSPSSIRRTEDGRNVIADTRNHRVLLLDAEGTDCQMVHHDGTFRDPVYAVLLDNGNCLVCDTGNKRVIELDEQGYIVWNYGAPVVSRRLLSYPRSVDVNGSGGYLIADTAHDRIIELVDEHVREMPFKGQPGLFWPRCARMLPSGSLLIADARNQRVVEVSADGEVLNQLTHIDLDGQQGTAGPSRRAHACGRQAADHRFIAGPGRRHGLDRQGLPGCRRERDRHAQGPPQRPGARGRRHHHYRYRAQPHRCGGLQRNRSA